MRVVMSLHHVARVRVVAVERDRGGALGEEVAGEVVADRLVLDEARGVVPGDPRVERRLDARLGRSVERGAEPVVTDGHADAVVADAVAVSVLGDSPPLPAGVAMAESTRAPACAHRVAEASSTPAAVW